MIQLVKCQVNLQPHTPEWQVLFIFICIYSMLPHAVHVYTAYSLTEYMHIDIHNNVYISISEHIYRVSDLVRQNSWIHAFVDNATYHGLWPMSLWWVCKLIVGNCWMQYWFKKSDWILRMTFWDYLGNSIIMLCIDWLHVVMVVADTPTPNTLLYWSRHSSKNMIKPGSYIE